MLSANEASRITDSYQNLAKKAVISYLEKSIMARAKDGIRWFSWDYAFSMEYNGLAENEKQEIIHELRSAGYDVKEHWILREVTICW